MGVAESADYIVAKIKQSRAGGQVYRGIVSGSYVQVNGMTLPFVVGTGVTTGDGDYVWVMLTESKTGAVVVGK